jgi:hypothetical protein
MKEKIADKLNKFVDIVATDGPINNDVCRAFEGYIIALVNEARAEGAWETADGIEALGNKYDQAEHQKGTPHKNCRPWFAVLTAREYQTSALLPKYGPRPTEGDKNLET